MVRMLKTFMTEQEAKLQYGILSGKVDTLTTLPLSFNIAIATAIVPAISAAIAKNDEKMVTKRVSFSMLATILIGLPCTFRINYICKAHFKFIISKSKFGCDIIAN